ncbi:zinc-binding dehydrogenase [Streptomyces sp. NPDC051453]|uniref:alcohol dehydrogenase catalytic domain-containing protein n=1 Tax=Streptomyces sp. NPDC051453 TaxID=3154941 RepID=UPI00342EB9F8
MKAWRLLAAGEPIQLVDIEDPVAGPGEIVLDVKAAGLCHTDYAYADGTLTHALAKIPITLGHEFAGVITQIGSGVTGFEIGQRVGVPTAEGGPGQTTDGGFAEKAKVGAQWVLPLPDGISWQQAAPATCGGMTAYHSLAIGGVTEGTKVGIIGAGGLGTIAVQIAVGLGAEVYVAEIRESTWDVVQSYGAKAVAKDIAEFSDEELPVIVDYAGFGTTTDGAIASVGRRGTVVQVGLGRARADISTQQLVFKDVSLIGSAVGSHEDCTKVMQLLADGKIAWSVTEIGLDDIRDGLERLHQGGVVGRQVALL